MGPIGPNQHFEEQITSRKQFTSRTIGRFERSREFSNKSTTQVFVGLKFSHCKFMFFENSKLITITMRWVEPIMLESDKGVCMWICTDYVTPQASQSYFRISVRSLVCSFLMVALVSTSTATTAAEHTLMMPDDDACPSTSNLTVFWPFCSFSVLITLFTNVCTLRRWSGTLGFILLLLGITHYSALSFSFPYVSFKAHVPFAFTVFWRRSFLPTIT